MLKSLLTPLYHFSKHPPPPPPAPLDPTAYYHNRKDSLSSLPTLYPSTFNPTKSILQFQTQYSTSIQEQPSESLAGRITKIRSHGKLSFLDIKQNGCKVQVAIEKLDPRLKRGDVVGVNGHPFRTNKGELTLKARNIMLLAPCFYMLPEEENLKDVEIRQRKRYLELMTNQETLGKLRIRAKVVQFLRKYLEEKEFLEVETPYLSHSAGGAIAKPFESYLHEMDMKLYMRIAPELYLKQLLIGGIPKVFEIGKNFRNEGIDTTHNPEFTTLELYEMYKGYEDMMEMTEEIVRGLVEMVTGGWEIEIGGRVVDFSKPWRRVSLIEGLEEATKSEFPKEFHSQEAFLFLQDLCKTHKIQCSAPVTAARLLDKLSSHFIEPLSSSSPLFIYKYPTCMSPLAKTCEANPHITQRFEGFINGWEICNSYTELNDPEIQKRNTPKDVEFVEALEYGLAPCAGLGIGVDRLVMVLTKSQTIQEVIAFPLTKPVVKGD